MSRKVVLFWLPCQLSYGENALKNCTISQRLHEWLFFVVTWGGGEGMIMGKEVLALTTLPFQPSQM